jgi:hypothetical protein
MVTEALSQRREGGGVELDRDDTRSGGCERACEHPGSGTEVDDQRACLDSGIPNELLCEGAATKGVTARRPRLP